MFAKKRRGELGEGCELSDVAFEGEGEDGLLLFGVFEVLEEMVLDRGEDAGGELLGSFIVRSS